jgi:hypothetical protein
MQDRGIVDQALRDNAQARLLRQPQGWSNLFIDQFAEGRRDQVMHSGRARPV